MEARRGDHALGRDLVHVNGAPSNAEFYDAQLNSTTLKRVAEETAGRYYTPANVSTLADDISYTGRGDTVTERMDLWDMPAVFVLLVLLIGARVPGSHIPTTSTKVLILLGFLVLLVPGVWFIVATLRDVSK